MKRFCCKGRVSGLRATQTQKQGYHAGKQITPALQNAPVISLLAKLIKDLSKDVGLSDVSLLEIGSAAETIDPAPNSLLSLTTNVMGSFASLNGTAVTWPWITVICNSVPCFQAMRFSPGRRPDTSLQELHILQRRPQGLFLYGSAANCYGCVSQTGSESFALLGNWCHQIKFIPELKLVASCSAADKSHDAYFASIKITQANSELVHNC
ncbi:EF-hand calcium-binding domain-containing protein 8 isoform 3-T4 [Alca torda]